MSVFGWFKRLGRTLDSSAEPTDVGIGGQSAPTAVLEKASAAIQQEVEEEHELEEGR
jgi:hypothetical protein